MKSFKRIAIASEEKIAQSVALILFDGGAGSISTALTILPREKAQALVEAMPEGKIAERLLAITENVEIGGVFANPEISLADESAEELHERLSGDIVAIISLASDEKFSRVLRHLVNMYIGLVDDVSTTTVAVVSDLADGNIRAVQKRIAENKHPLGTIKRSHLHAPLDTEGNADRKAPVLVVNNNTYEEYSAKARTEIITDTVEDPKTGHERHLIDFIKFLLLQDVLMVVFDAIKTSERFEDIQRVLSVGLRIKLEGQRLVTLVDPDTEEVTEIIISDGPVNDGLEDGSSLITEQELAANPYAAREVARIVRDAEEIAQLRAEVEVRRKQKRPSKLPPAAQAWLAQHTGDLAKFDKVDAQLEGGDSDTVSLEEVDERGRRRKPKRRKTREPKGLEFDE